LIRREPVQVYRRHPSALIKHMGGCLCLRWSVSNEQTTGYYAAACCGNRARCAMGG
jgi:hypothetical protein